MQYHTEEEKAILADLRRYGSISIKIDDLKKPQYRTYSRLWRSGHIRMSGTSGGVYNFRLPEPASTKETEEG